MRVIGLGLGFGIYIGICFDIDIGCGRVVCVGFGVGREIGR